MRKGFTLIEILTVLGIIAVIAGVSVTFLRGAAQEGILQASARDVASDLRYAAELSVSTQINHAVRFDQVASRYTVIELTTPETTIKQSSLTPGLSFSTITLPQNQAEFNTLGAVVATGTVTILNQSGGTRLLDIRPSGYVQIR